MSVKDCLARLVESGHVSRETAGAARALWERYQGRFSLDMPPASAEVAAALQAAREMGAASKAKRYSVAQQVIKQTAAEAEQMAHPWGPAAGAMARLAKDIYRRGGDNVDTRAQFLKEALFSRFNAGFEAYKSTFAGLKQDVAGAQNMVREIFGVDTGDPVAKAAAQGWRDATQFATDYVVAAGKVFEAMEDWRLPQFWNSDRVRRFGPEAFVAHMKRAIEGGGVKVWDKERFEFATDASRLDALLAKAARDIITEAGAAPVFSKEMRTFHFQEGSAGAEAFLELQGKYGAGQDILNTLTGHLGAMAREGAMVDVLGPQHAATARLLEKNARDWEKLGRPGARWESLLPRSMGLESAGAIKRTYAVLSGAANGVENQFWAGVMGSTRSLLTASSLGSAVVPAVIGDSVTTLLAARWNGMPFMNVVGRAVETMVAENPQLQADAARLLVTGHAMSDHAIGTLRYPDHRASPELLRKTADFVIRASGLNAWTEAMKKAFTMEMLGYVAGQSGRDLKGVDKAFGEFLDRYRVSAAEWDRLRALPQQDVRGAKFFDSSLAAEDPAVRKLFEGILTERGYAVLEPDARVRSVSSQGVQAGTFVGEIARNVSMFKSFSMTMASTHLMAMAVRDGSIGSRMLNAIPFFALHLAAGAAIIQARQLLSGKDPRDMDLLGSMNGVKFWFQAAAQGGGLGYYGDLFTTAATGTERHGGIELLGPVASLAEDARRLAQSTVQKTYEGQFGSTTGQGIDLLRRVTPGSNLWFSRLATDRLIWDALHRAADPKYAEGFQRRQQRDFDSYRQRSWWRPGETTPQRGPDFGAAFPRLGP